MSDYTPSFESHQRYIETNQRIQKWLNETLAHTADFCDPNNGMPLPASSRATQHSQTPSVSRLKEIFSRSVLINHQHTATSPSRIPTLSRQPPSPLRRDNQSPYSALLTPHSERHPPIASDSYQYTPSERANVMGRMYAELGTYPPRPRYPLSSSTSVDAFRAVLARAPASPLDIGMKMIYSNATGTPVHFWGDEYMDGLFQALIDVIHEHGLEEYGWESARWEVYDKGIQYSNCIGGVRYIRTGPGAQGLWHDDAKDWLRGYIKPSRDFLLTVRRDQCSMKGGVYNRMLPVVTFKIDDNSYLYSEQSLPNAG